MVPRDLRAGAAEKAARGWVHRSYRVLVSLLLLILVTLLNTKTIQKLIVCDTFLAQCNWPR